MNNQHPQSPSMMSPAQARQLSDRLLAWYDRHRRAMPWRSLPGERPDPYHVWLSEIMLQQTTVATVSAYFTAFLARWPRLSDLARAPLDDVLHAWQGLGYYARARNLHACAQAVMERHRGRFPDTEEKLRALPGVGSYTAAAIAAIAFGRRAVVVDGNVERVMARLFAVTQPLPAARPRLRALAALLTPVDRPGDYAQAVMDLGATLCSPRRPACTLCPWSQPCAGRLEGIAETLPAKEAKAERPTRYGVAFLTARGEDGALLLRRRAASGLLGGMIEVPSTDWRDRPWDPDEARRLAPAAVAWRQLPGAVVHVFTHFRLEIVVLAGTVRTPSGRAGEIWCPPDRLGEQALPTVMKKIIAHAGVG